MSNESGARTGPPPGVWIGSNTGLPDELDSSISWTTGTLPVSRTRNPDTELDADVHAHAPNAMDCVILGKTGVYSRSLYADIQHLVRSYEKRDCIDFPTFSSIWKAQQFSLIHFGCGDQNGREHFMLLLYEIVLNFLSPEETFPAQVGAIYSLYLLYFTQPTVFRKVPVRLTITAWQNLELLYQIAFEYDATDLIYVIHKLRDRGAFLYVAQNDRISKELRDENADLLDRTERTLVRMEKKINASPLVPVDTLLSDLSKMAAMYHEAKADLVSLSLARRSSEMVMAHLSKLKPPDLNIREATPLPAFLKDKMIAREAPSGISARSAATIATTADDSSLRSANKNVARIPEPLPDRPLIMFEQLPPTSEDATFSSSDTRPDPNQNFTSVLATEPPVSESTASIGSPNQNYRNPDYDDIAPRASPSKKRHAKRPVTLPNVFSYSMLQASRADFPQKIENISRNYIRDRIARFEFAATGGLPRNEYRFPETPLMVKRRKPLEIDQEDPEEKERLRMEQLEEKKARAKERQRGREQRKRDLDKMKTEEERARDQSEQDPEGACMEERAQGQAGTDREQGSRGQAAESAEQVREDGEQGAQGVQGQSAASTDQARQETIGNHDYNGLERQDNGSMES